MMFINADSLKQMNDSIDITETNSALFASLLVDLADTLRNLGDSLTIIQDSIANGGDLDNEQAYIENAISHFSNDQAAATENKTIQDSLTLVMNEVVTLLNTGRNPVSKIEFIETGDTLLYLDSAINYTLPLSFDQLFTTYGITIDNFTYEIEVDYTIEEEVDIERNVLLRAKDIQIILPMNSFDSLQTCEICTDGEASFILYF
ncbi:MAG: hypothetical protein AB8B73_00740 [Ekhidna sp.]